jgi:hypothetical protein
MTMSPTFWKRPALLLGRERFLDLRALVARKSHFVFGPRQTGKTFLEH